MTRFVAGGSILTPIAFFALAIICWHWFESGENFGVGTAMAWQDVKVATSCRSVSTTSTFFTRSYEDFLLDKPIFAAPGWKHFICPIYATSAIRTQDYREATQTASCAALPDDAADTLSRWLAATQASDVCDDWEWYP